MLRKCFGWIDFKFKIEFYFNVSKMWKQILGAVAGLRTVEFHQGRIIADL